MPESEAAYVQACLDGGVAWSEIAKRMGRSEPDLRQAFKNVIPDEDARLPQEPIPPAERKRREQQAREDRKLTTWRSTKSRPGTA